VNREINESDILVKLYELSNKGEKDVSLSKLANELDMNTIEGRTKIFFALTFYAMHGNLRFTFGDEHGEIQRYISIDEGFLPILEEIYRLKSKEVIKNEKKSSC